MVWHSWLRGSFLFWLTFLPWAHLKTRINCLLYHNNTTSYGRFSTLHFPFTFLSYIIIHSLRKQMVVSWSLKLFLRYFNTSLLSIMMDYISTKAVSQKKSNIAAVSCMVKNLAIKALLSVLPITTFLFFIMIDKTQLNFNKPLYAENSAFK